MLVIRKEQMAELTRLKQPCIDIPCPPADFNIETPCRIVNVNGGQVEMSAIELPGSIGGNYIWTTTSLYIKLINTSSPTVIVEGLDKPSAGRDAEIISVTRSAFGCPNVTKSVTVTVAKVTFSASTNQLYGFENFDSPTDQTDNHICIKKSDYTFLKVVIEGGALGTDFDFVCDNPSVCTPVPPDATASFDLRLNAEAKNKRETTLNAKVKCPSATSFAKIAVHVYKEKKVDVVVAKIYDKTSRGATLLYPDEDYSVFTKIEPQEVHMYKQKKEDVVSFKKFNKHSRDTALLNPDEDYSAFTNTVNEKLKEAVVKFNISNYDPDNKTTDVRYDLDGNGALTYDIANGGGIELEAINSAMTGTGTKTRIAIVRDMKSYYYLSAKAARGDLKVTVTAFENSIFYIVGENVDLGIGSSKENVTIASVSGRTITLKSVLTQNHKKGEPMELPAAGWSSDPIVIIEGKASLEILKWTIPHEVGHRDLQLADVEDDTNIMHFKQGHSDNRLRYCSRDKKYKPFGSENQWDTIPR
jgi:hypothetical protein